VTKTVDQSTVDVSNLCKHVDVTYNVSLGLNVQERFTATGSVLVSTTANITVFSMTAPGCTFSGCVVRSTQIDAACLGLFCKPLAGSPSVISAPFHLPTNTPRKTNPPYPQPASPRTNLTANSKLNCTLFCDFSAKPASTVIYVQVGWGLEGAAAATNNDWGYIFINSATLNVIDPCAYLHDIANDDVPRLLVQDPFCYDQLKGTQRQTWGVDPYVTTLTSDDCTGRYTAPAAAPTAGRRRLQQSCKNKKSTTTTAEYRNLATASRDAFGHNVMVSSPPAVVTLTCPAGCAGANSYLQTATSCCQCSNTEEWKASTKTCVACKAGWALDTSYKCKSICYTQYGASRPVYKAPTATAPYDCLPCPATKSDYEPNLGECLAPCPPATPNRIPGTRTCTAQAQARVASAAAGATAQQPFLVTGGVTADTGSVAPAASGDALLMSAASVAPAAAAVDCAYSTLTTLSEFLEFGWES
jgi:hypothetical protein